MSCSRPSKTAVTCSDACQASVDALAKRLAASDALTDTAQRFTRLTPRIYLLLASVLFVLALIIASLTQNRVLAPTAPALWLLAGFCALFGFAVALVWWKLRARRGGAVS